MARKITSYTKAYEELQDILGRIQSDEVSVDDLSKNIKRASELIEFCKEKLRSTEEEIEELTK